MTKTFKSKYSPAYELSISGEHGGIVVRQIRDGGCKWSIALDPADAPAIALAFLNAANIVHHDPEDTPCNPALRTEQMGALNIAAFHLAQHVAQAEKAAHIAADQKALESEAEALYEVRTAGCNFQLVPAMARAEWIAVARKARELHGGTK